MLQLLLHLVDASAVAVTTDVVVKIDKIVDKIGAARLNEQSKTMIKRILNSWPFGWKTIDEQGSRYTK